ncbi:MAG: alpha/beta hydrolase [Phycisphaerae bacterium]
MPQPATIPQHPPRPCRFRRLRSLAWKILRIYLLVVLVLALFQKKLIFIGASTQGTPEAQVSPVDAELLRLHTTDTPPVPIAALFGKAINPANPATAPTLLWFYGNAMCMNDALPEFLLFRRLGCNVLLVDYTGYGMSGGEASEQGCYDAAETAYQYLLTRPDIDRQRLVPAGWSLGGAVAIDLAARHADDPHIAAVMTFSTFTSMADVAQHHYPFAPVKLLLTQRFDSEQKLPRIHVPILIGHGRRDAIVPFALSDRLANAAAGKVTRLISPAADHNDFFDIAANDVTRTAATFLQDLNHQAGQR